MFRVMSPFVVNVPTVDIYWFLTQSGLFKLWLAHCKHETSLFQVEIKVKDIRLKKMVLKKPEGAGQK